jgi:hypothetical protein
LVNFIIKVVASMLALSLLGMPVAALASCRPSTAMAGHCGGERCPMTRARQNSRAQVSEAPSVDDSCCQVSSLPQTPVKEAINREGKTSAAPISSQTTVIAVMPLSMSAETHPASGPAVSLSSQALFCTFLI